MAIADFVIGNDPVSKDYKSFSNDLSSLADSSPEEIMKYATEHPFASQNYSSFFDSLISQAYNKQNFDYEYAKNHDYTYMMDQLKKAGINPTLAFRSSLGFSGSSMGSVQSNYASELAKKASLSEQQANRDQKHDEFLTTIFKTVGVALIGALIAIL